MATSKFDLIYEDILWSLRENVLPTDNDFESDVKTLVHLLSDADLIQPNYNLDTIVAHAVHDKKINLDDYNDIGIENKLPPIVITLKGENKVDSITVKNLKEPNTPAKDFGTQVEDSLFPSVVDYIKTLALQSASPEAAVETLPASTGANAQPAGETTPAPAEGESALPGV